MTTVRLAVAFRGPSRAPPGPRLIAVPTASGRLTASLELITQISVKPKRFPRYAVLLFLLALAASAQAADVEKVDALIEKAIAPYREMDGKVYFAGRYLYAAYGIISKIQAKTNSLGTAHIFRGFWVLDVTTNGCRIIGLPHKDEPDPREVFIDGFQDKGFYSGHTYRGLLMAFQRKSNPTYTFETTGAGGRTIPRYEFGKEITKGEYLARVDKQIKNTKTKDKAAD